MRQGGFFGYFDGFYPQEMIKYRRKSFSHWKNFISNFASGWLLTLRWDTSGPGSVGIGGWYNPPKKSYMQLSAEAVLCTSFRPWWYKLITGETNFGACGWRRHGGSIVLAAKQRNPILGVKNKFLWKITTAIEIYAQKLTYMPIFMNFGQLSFFFIYLAAYR